MLSSRFVPIAVLLTLSVCSAVSAAGPENRPRVKLAGTWQMQFVDGPGSQPTGKWTDKTLPHGTYYGSIRFPLPKKGDAEDAKKKRPNGLWLQRTVTVPAAWQGRRVVLHIGKLLYGCKVVVEGKPCGEILWHGGSVDVTDAVNFDKPTTVRLFFGRGGTGIAGVDAVAKAAVEDFLADTRWDKGSYFAGVDCMPDEFYLESRPVDHVIADVWYRTYTRGYVHVDPLITVNSTQPLAGSVLEVTLYDPATGKSVARNTTAATLPAGQSTHETVIKSAGRLKLWELTEPNLYLAQAVLRDAGGKVLDRSDVTRIGVREIWVQGRHVYLNGRPVSFIDYFFSTSPPEGANLLYDHASTGRHITTNQMASIRWCDENGYGYMAFGVPVHALELSDEKLLKDYRDSVRQHVKRMRNHPSVLFYGLGMNMGGGWVYFNPEVFGSSAIVNTRHVEGTVGTMVHHEADPTRPVYFHGTPTLGDIAGANIYFNFTARQEVVDWLERWAARGDRPLVINEFMGGPLGVDFQKDLVSYITEYVARWRGDAAYTAEPDHLVDYTVYDVPRLTSHWQYRPFDFSKMALDVVCRRRPVTTRAWRYWGASVHPWVFPPERTRKPGQVHPVPGAETIWQVGLETMKPVQVWIGGPQGDWTRTDVRTTSGRTIERSAMMLRDLPGSVRWSYRWRASMDGKPVAVSPEAGEVEVGAYDRRQLPTRLTAPEVDRPTELTLKLEVTGPDGKAMAADETTITVFPRGWSTATGSAMEPHFDVLDPAGGTADLLKRAGAYLSPWRPGKPRPYVLVVGRNALSGVKELPFTAEQVARGTRVVVFEQRSELLQKLGLRVEDCAPRRAFVRQPGHPTVRGITDRELTSWRGDGTLLAPGPERDGTAVSRRLFRSSNRGTVASVVADLPDVGPFSAPIVTEFDLDYTPLLSWRHGLGEVVFCQLDVTGRTEEDPAAGRIVRNLVEYLARPLPGKPQERSVLTLTDKSAARMRALGYAAETSTLEKMDFTKQIVAVTRHDGKAVAEVADKLSGFTGRGGEVVVFGADAAMLKQLKLDDTVTATPAALVRAARTVDDHPLLAGVGPNVVRWREPVSVNVLTGTDAGATALLGGVMLDLKRGAGRYLFVQVDETTMDDYDTIDRLEKAKDAGGTGVTQKAVPRAKRVANRQRARRHVDRLCASVLGNLRAASSPDLVQRLFTVRQTMPIAPVNEWWYVGPFFAGDLAADPLETDLSNWMDNVEAEKSWRNNKDEPVRWYRPTDANNGLGSGGKMLLTQKYGTRLKAVVLARTWVWSSRSRTARVNLGADWWMRVTVNGKEVFRTVSDKDKKIWTFGGQFAHKNVPLPLQKGWNRITCVVGSGSTSHAFWFAMSNPGDLVVAQSLAAPTEPPKGIPAPDRLMTESDKPAYPLYTFELTPENDPYRFYAW